nr:hypothetical protein BN993_06607 [Virgibacillus halodenitrificans]
MQSLPQSGWWGELAQSRDVAFLDCDFPFNQLVLHIYFNNIFFRSDVV